MASMDYSTVSVNMVNTGSREQCVMNCRRNLSIKQLWSCHIRKKPSQTCGHFRLYILHFIEVYLNKLNSLHFREKSLLIHNFPTNNYLLQKDMKQSYTCFPKTKGICTSATHWCVCLVYAATMTAYVWPYFASTGPIMSNKLHKRQYIFGHMTLNMW